jgi:hypothetical protein
MYSGKAKVDSTYIMSETQEVLNGKKYCVKDHSSEGLFPLPKPKTE